MATAKTTKKNVNAGDLLSGAFLQCCEASTLGMPFEVWKTRMGRFRHETTFQAFRNVMRDGNGVLAFWNGLTPKLVESASKGAILLFSKEAIANSMMSMGSGETLAGFVAGAGGGVCQTVVMAPCTYLITGAVTGADKSITMSQRMKVTYATHGIKGFFPGASAIAWRQATNWASRQGFTDFIRNRMKQYFHEGDYSARLTVAEEAGAGIIGGALACWNHPFEVARIEMQARANAGESKETMTQVFRAITREQGVGGLFKGIVPRLFLGIWQTLLMVTGAKLLKQAIADHEEAKQLEDD